jgi:hypothetical protein
MGSTKRARDNRRLPWSGAPDCPVHQGTPSQTSHLREFSEALRYNSPDYPVHHRTMSGAPEESDSKLVSFGFPLRYNSPDCPVSQRSNDYFAPTVDCNALNACQRAQRSRARASGTPDSLQDLSGAPPDSQAGPHVRLQRSEPNGLVTWLAHRTLSGGAPVCPVRHAIAASTKRLVWWLGL